MSVLSPEGEEHHRMNEALRARRECLREPRSAWTGGPKESGPGGDDFSRTSTSRDENSTGEREVNVRKFR
jgi:hypothetical protein